MGLRRLGWIGLLLAFLSQPLGLPASATETPQQTLDCRSSDADLKVQVQIQSAQVQLQFWGEEREFIRRFEIVHSWRQEGLYWVWIRNPDGYEASMTQQGLLVIPAMRRRELPVDLVFHVIRRQRLVEGVRGAATRWKCAWRKGGSSDSLPEPVVLAHGERRTFEVGHMGGLTRLELQDGVVSFFTRERGEGGRPNAHETLFRLGETSGNPPQIELKRTLCNAEGCTYFSD